MEALRNSDQSVAEGRLGFSKAASLTGELAGLRLVFGEGVRGPLYRLLQQEAGWEKVTNTLFSSSSVCNSTVATLAQFTGCPSFIDSKNQ